MSQPKMLELDPKLLSPNTWNTNIVSPDNETKLEESIKRNGVFKPVIVREVDGRYEILGGEHRWQVAVKLNLPTVPVMNLGPIDEKRAKEISIIDNSRYGADDTLSFAELLKSLGDTADLLTFLPFGDEDLSSIFSSSFIELDDLDIDGNFDKKAEEEEEAPEPPQAKAPKTHTLMRFKVSLGDAERLTALLARTMKNQGFTTEDDLTNAGDALVHLLVSQFMTPAVSEALNDEDLDTALSEIEP